MNLTICRLVQDFNSFATYMNQFRSAEFYDAVADLHVLVFMANLDIIPLRSTIYRISFLAYILHHWLVSIFYCCYRMFTVFACNTVATRAREPEPVGTGCFLPLGAGAGLKKKPGAGAGSLKL